MHICYLSNFVCLETPLCEADTIFVHNGPNATASPFGTFCQQGSNVTITSTGNQLFVIFRSAVSHSEQFKGFEATFREGRIARWMQRNMQINYFKLKLFIRKTNNFYGAQKYNLKF